MAWRTPLLCQHLENIFRGALEKYQDMHIKQARGFWILLLFSPLSILWMVSCAPQDNGTRTENAVTAFFRERKCGQSPDWAIEKAVHAPGGGWTHVITVHGFANDSEAAQMVVDLLNKNTNDTYRCVPLNE